VKPLQIGAAHGREAVAGCDCSGGLLAQANTVFGHRRAFVFLEIAFHLPDVPFISPMVSLWWEAEVIDLLNAFPADLWRCGSSPEAWFANFIAASVALPGIDRSRIEIRNIPIPTEWLANDRGRWYGRLMAEFQEFDSPPILVNLNYPCEARQPGFRVWRLVTQMKSPNEASGARWVESGQDTPLRPAPDATPDGGA
jgi:hypothetical protein